MEYDLLRQSSGAFPEQPPQPLRLLILSMMSACNANRRETLNEP
jgi:hypothetical protein